MKRKLTLFLSAVMVASSLPMTAYAANFKDINDVPWDGVQSVINSVADKGLLGGYEDNTFRARTNVTYCEAMQMVYKTMTKSGMAEPVSAMDIYSYTATLNSLKVPVWAHTAVAYGLQNGIIDLQMVAQKFGSNGSQVATREDVAFTGWYKDAARTTLWDFANDVVPESGDLVLYAGWEIVPVVEETPEIETPAVDVNGTETTPSNNNVIIIVVVAAVVLLVVAGVVVILAKKKKKAK